MSAFLPTRINAGVTFEKRVSLSQYLAPAWVLLLLLRGPSNKDVTAAADGSAHVLALGAAETSAMTPGDYAYSLRVKSGGTVHEVEAGRLTLAPDLANLAAGSDTRSQARRTLDAIDAVIEKRASQDQEKYRINNRELWRTPLADLLLLRDRYAFLVAREERKARGKGRFGPAVVVRL